LIKEKIKINSQQLCDTIVEGMQENKAKEITILDLRRVKDAVCDFFVICSGESNIQIDGISASVQRHTRKTIHEKPWHVEGTKGSNWILIDYVNVVAHVFSRELRAYYDLEDLWADAVITKIPDIY